MLDPVLADLAATPILSIGPFETRTELALSLYQLVGAALGLFIAYLAFRGYQRNGSRPMLFIAIGFFLILGSGVVVFGIFLLVPTLSEAMLQAVVQTFEIIGLLSIIYALRMDT